MTRSNHSQFIWNLFGSLSTALVSVVLLWIVSRTLPLDEADMFSFAYSFGNLMVIVGLFQVRNFQATDLRHEYSFASYLLLRLLTATAMLLLSLAYVFFGGLSGTKAQVVILVICFRLADVLSDVFQGFYQQHNRLDKAGKYLTVRNGLSLLIFGLMLSFSKGLSLSLAGVSLLSLAYVYCYDWRKSFTISPWAMAELWQKETLLQAKSILLATFPLFLNGFILLYIYNNPKYVLDNLLEAGVIPSGLQTYFNVLFMPAFVMNLVMLFFRPQLTKMADFFTSRDMLGFHRLQYQILLYLGLFSALVLIGSWILGIPALELVYGLSLSPYKRAFLWLMAGGVLGSFATAFDNFLTILRQQRFLLVSYLGSLLMSLIITKPLVQARVLEGAALSYFITMLVWLLLSVLTYSYLNHRMKEVYDVDSLKDKRNN
ncbi:lipopolysaccharide biosynthesis protein [Streptococcus cuniculipharyngis]|uniref:Lipopolysaccharide biosynthesis protein n=1 Tax=Streptococcus cuniculipharyngis TaxID=1562651 RepID=A0A5C5SF67_9STRE|nr:lipopolysaccharide biosynthesis protein [Streptococcus cuniculipharyngis]TWS98952.1 lipopolysaccharide biosynthesis protein [Streptococcus cuniculipharyngis]